MERESVWEDTGYQGRPMEEQRLYHVRNEVEKIKVEYIRGMSKGSKYWLRKDFAEDLIKRGWAIEIKEYRQ